MSRRLMKAADLVGRILLSLVIVFGIVFCIQIVLDIRSTDDGNVGQSEQHVSSSLAIETAMRNMVNGSWQFAGMPWNVSVQELSEDQAMQNFESPPPPLPDPTSGLRSVPEGSANRSKDIAAEQSNQLELIMETLEMMGAQPKEEGDYIVYLVDQANLHAKAFAPKGDARQVQYARVIQRSGDELWNFIEIAAKQNDAVAQSMELLPLLPRGPKTQRLAVRTDQQGAACGELIELGEPLLTAKQRWQDAGWKIQVLTGTEVEKTDALNDVEIGESIPLAAEVLVCTRNLEVIIAVPSKSMSTENETVLLVRAPE